MKHGLAKSRILRFLTLAFLLSLLLFSIRLSAAAKVSMKSIKTVSGGKFIKENNTWKYKYKNGKYAKNCLLNIDGKTYYFSKSGNRQSGWKKIEGNYYYFGKSSEGYMYKLRWLKTKNGTYYFLKKSGKRATGWMTYKGKTYYFDKNGKRLNGWQVINKKKYYLGTADEGYKYTNRWFTYKNRIFYLKKDGTPTVGWSTIDGKHYYFSKEGRASKGTKTINGVKYYFNNKGVLLHSGANITLSSDCAILINATTGKVLYEKNADTRHANASTTKIMTCLLALENAKLTDQVTVSANAASQEPTKLYMRTGDSFEMKDLLYSLMLPSHNDTAVAIAEHISGTTKKFAALMNKKAKALGCTNTNFVTPNGLDRNLNHYSSARDIAKIAQYALKNKTFKKIINTTQYSFSSSGGITYTVASTNELLGKMTGINGMKTGYTSKAGYCFVGTIKGKNGNTYLSVTLGASTSTARWDDSKKLLEYAYKQK